MNIYDFLLLILNGKIPNYKNEKWYLEFSDYQKKTLEHELSDYQKKFLGESKTALDVKLFLEQDQTLKENLKTYSFPIEKFNFQEYDRLLSLIKIYSKPHYLKEVTFKLIAIFNTAQNSLDYLSEHFKQGGRIDLSSVCQFEFPKNTQWTIQFWRELAKREKLNLNFFRCLRIADKIEFTLQAHQKEISEQLKYTINPESGKLMNIPFKIILEYAPRAAFKHASKDLVTARQFFLYDFDENAFDLYQLSKVSSQDSDELVPNLKIDGKDIHEACAQFYLEKIPSNAPEVPLLGKFTSCCQHMGDRDGSRALMYAMKNPHMGFYVLRMKKNHRIFAQAIAHRSKANDIIFDSVEAQINFKQNHPFLIADFFTYLSHLLVTKHGIHQVLTGVISFVEIDRRPASTSYFKIPEIGLLKTLAIKNENLLPIEETFTDANHVQWIIADKTLPVAQLYAQARPEDVQKVFGCSNQEINLKSLSEQIDLFLTYENAKKMGHIKLAEQLEQLNPIHALHFAAQHGDEALLEKILTSYPNLGINEAIAEKTAFMRALEAKQWNILRKLATLKGIDPNAVFGRDKDPTLGELCRVFSGNNQKKESEELFLQIAKIPGLNINSVLPRSIEKHILIYLASIGKWMLVRAISDIDTVFPETIQASLALAINANHKETIQYLARNPKIDLDAAKKLAEGKTEILNIILEAEQSRCQGLLTFMHKCSSTVTTTSVMKPTESMDVDSNEKMLQLMHHFL